MKRIAAPMIGGGVTSAILELLIYPVIFVIWRRRSLPKDARDEHPEAIADDRPVCRHPSAPKLRPIPRHSPRDRRA